MRLTAILVSFLVILALASNVTSGSTKKQYSLNNLVEEARQELEADLHKQTVNGGQTRKVQKLRNKVTKESRAMAFRNKMVKLVRSKLEAAGEGKESAAKIAREATLVKLNRDKVYKAGGQSGFTNPVVMVDDMCKGMEMKCDASYKYYRIDGKCNNILKGKEMVGSMSSPFRREVPHVTYNISKIPILAAPVAYIYGSRSEGDNGTDRALRCDPVAPKPAKLPSPRLLSTKLHSDTDVPDRRCTHMLTQWGQFLDHDITLTPEHEGEDECCDTPVHEHCLPILVPPGDNAFVSEERAPTCLPFSRSVNFCEGSETPEQINAITHFIDASNVYGSDKQQAKNLRENKDGLLKVSEGNLLPLVDEAFFDAGDGRFQEMPGLMSMHTLWVREHNRLAVEIKKVNPSFSDEIIYQEARRLVIAQMQTIIYNEYLPIVLGETYAKDPKNGLTTPATGTKYDPSINPSVENGFATAAFRFGHSMIQGLIKVFMAATGAHVKDYKIRDHFFDPENYEAGMENILLGLTIQPAQKFDQHVTEDATNHLFGNQGHATDLVARNIQRGRDHGLGGYAKYRYRFHKDKTQIDCWTKRPSDISDPRWKELAKLYVQPYDIDVFSGGLLEDPAGDAIVGGTFQGMIADTFAKLKNGDRFFFSHSGEAGSFSQPQREAIVKRRLSDVMCDNTKIGRLQENAFLQAHPAKNKVNPCTANRKLDVNLLVGDAEQCNGSKTYVITSSDLSLDQAGSKSFFTVV